MRHVEITLSFSVLIQLLQMFILHPILLIYGFYLSLDMVTQCLEQCSHFASIHVNKMFDFFF